MHAKIALENGLCFTGRLIGASREVGGEVVFHTGMTGYQEILTDPSYAGQIVVFTASHIGNYGVHAGDDESARIHPSAILVRDFCRRSFHRRADRSLADVLRRAGVPALAGVDTRALTIAIRDRGTCRAWIGAGEPEALTAKARALPLMEEVDWVSRVTSEEPWTLEAAGAGPEPPFEVAVYDFGVKRSILHRIALEGCRVRVFPASAPAEELLAPPTEGVFLSNGPGDPATLPAIVEQVKAVLRSGLPLFGICLGHQILARALGADTVKLPFGHHGANHPVKRLADGRVEITSQNHNYAVPAESLPPDGARITHLSLNDGTVEGLEVPGAPVFSVQYHPEAAPGPSDSQYLFRLFRENLDAERTRRKGGGRDAATK
ncbi:MAG: glutamine-hydrolyzing carbamoyl-phosphate synthase small subunit [Candidatus Eisenbacteria bacterium]